LFHSLVREIFFLVRKIFFPSQRNNFFQSEKFGVPTSPDSSAEKETENQRNSQPADITLRSLTYWNKSRILCSHDLFTHLWVLPTSENGSNFAPEIQTKRDGNAQTQQLGTFKHSCWKRSNTVAGNAQTPPLKPQKKHHI
jgi:hypothetical protein